MLGKNLRDRSPESGKQRIGEGVADHWAWPPDIGLANAGGLPPSAFAAKLVSLSVVDWLSVGLAISNASLPCNQIRLG